MPAYVDIVTALPKVGDGDKGLTREALVKRYAYCLADSDDLSTITVTDPDYGSIPLYVVQQRRLFQYDSTDATTAADGTTCLVSADGKRYKIDDYLLPWSVKSKTLTVPPVSPSIGDSYIVAVASTGAWSGKDNQIATFTSRSWLFTTMPEGRKVYNEADGAFYYRDQTGSWIRGAGSLSFSSNAVPLSSIIGAAASLMIRVENQTTNAPPGTAAVGTYYVIGPSPTGSWAGNAGKIAACEVVNTFTIYTPKDGDTVYDKATLGQFRWSAASSSWQTASGSMKCVTHFFGTNGTFSKDARSVMVHVTVVGSSGGSNDGAGATNGSVTSFGAHISVPGGVAANGNTPAGSAGSGGDLNFTGNTGIAGVIGGITAMVFSNIGFGVRGPSTSASPGAGVSVGWILSTGLGTNEAITVGTGGGAGGVGGVAGNQGCVIVEEWVLT